MWKICTKCKKHKALWLFHRQQRGLFSSTPNCKLCNNKRSKKNYDLNKEAYYETSKIWLSKNRERINAEWKKKYAIDPEFRKHVKEKRRRNYNPKTAKKYNKEWNKNNPELKKEYQKTARLKKAKFESFENKLTVEESPRLAKDGKSLEVKCKQCKKYFIPITGQIYDRIYCLNTIDEGEAHTYCSEECKNKCPVYRSQGALGLKTNRERIPDFVHKEVLSRNNGMCERCGKRKSKILHHIKPVAYELIEQLDWDVLMGVCQECHDKIHHQPGCTYPELRENSVNNCEVK